MLSYNLYAIGIFDFVSSYIPKNIELFNRELISMSIVEIINYVFFFFFILLHFFSPSFFLNFRPVSFYITFERDTNSAMLNRLNIVKSAVVTYKIYIEYRILYILISF